MNQMEQTETKEQPSTAEQHSERLTAAQRLMGRLKENKNSIHISQIPLRAKEAFENLAKEEFLDHYGMTLKWLMDDLISPDTKMLIATIDALEKRVVALEESKDDSVKEEESGEHKPVYKKMVDGTKRRVK